MFNLASREASDSRSPCLCFCESLLRLKLESYLEIVCQSWWVGWCWGCMCVCVCAAAAVDSWCFWQQPVFERRLHHYPGRATLCTLSHPWFVCLFFIIVEPPAWIKTSAEYIWSIIWLEKIKHRKKVLCARSCFRQTTILDHSKHEVQSHAQQSMRWEAGKESVQQHANHMLPSAIPVALINVICLQFQCTFRCLLQIFLELNSQSSVLEWSYAT